YSDPSGPRSSWATACGMNTGSIGRLLVFDAVTRGCTRYGWRRRLGRAGCPPGGDGSDCARSAPAVDFGDVGVVLVEGSGKQMGAAAVCSRYEVEIVGFGRLEGGANAGFARVADGARREATTAIGVVGG